MKPLPFAIALSLLLSTVVDLRADALVVTRAMKADTIAEFSIGDDAVTVDLEIGIGDLPAFINLLPDELCEKLGLDAAPWKERLPRFFAEDFRVLADGEPLAGRLVEMEGRKRIVRDEITGEPLPPAGGTEPGAVVSARLVYPLDHRPATLTLGSSQPKGSGGAIASIGFVAYHEDLPVNDFRYLSREETLDLDWDDPWYSKFRNRNLHRRRLAPIEGYLYVEPFEVRKEIVARPRDLENWIDLGLGDREVITAEEQPAILEKVAAFLGKRAPVAIDGRPVKLELDRIHFIRRTLRTTSVVDPPEDLPAVSAIIGAIFITRTDGFPEEVTMEWDLFTPRVDSMLGTATDQAGSLPQQVTADDPVLVWKNFLTNPELPSFVELKPPPGRPRLSLPLLSLSCGAVFLILLAKGRNSPAPRLTRGRKFGAVAALAGAALLWPLARVAVPLPFARPAALGEEEVGDLVSGLLRNTYRAFDYRDESVIYDTLARSVSGDLLTDVYLDIRKALELQNQGGARAKVTAIELTNAKAAPLDNGPAFRANCTWTVAGSVGHWGHVHQRRNEYRANITVQPDADSWKISALELLDEKRL